MRKVLFLVYYSDMHTLYLTGEERKVFAKLPAELTKDLTVEDERLEYEDNARRRSIRLKHLSVNDTSLKNFFATAALAASEAEFVSMLGALDLKSVSNDDVAEIMFAVGPDGTSFMIAQALEHAENRDAVELATALSLLRHEMLDSLTAPIV